MRRTLPIFFTCISALILAGCNLNKAYHAKTIQTTSVAVDSLEQIVLVSDSLVKPMLYTKVSGLEFLSVSKAKAIFVSAVLPSILVARYRVEENKRKLLYLKEKKSWGKSDSIFYRNLKIKYKASSLNDLLARMITLPNSLVLAQAAVESGWGQSRFFLEGSNLFGVWSFNRYEPRIAAGKTRSKKKIYLRSYKDMSESIVHYFEIIGKARPYIPLRLARQKTEDPFVLLTHLKNFSERRSAYTRQLKNMIDVNDFTRYDHYQINPEYIHED
jgi:Bax protein